MDDREHRTTGDKPKSRGPSWLRGLLYAVPTCLMLAIGLVLLAGTAPVLRLVMPTVQKAVSTVIDGRLATDGIRGSLWTGLTLDSLDLALPATGLAVEGRGLALQWSPLALLKGAVQVDRLAAASLAVALPKGPAPEQPPEEPSGTFVLPLSVRLGQLDLPRVEITEPKSGRRFSYAVSAAGAAGKRAAELSLALTPREEDLDRLRVDLAFNADRRELRAEIEGRFDRTGLVMTLAGLPAEKATDVGIKLQGEGPADGWRGHLQLAAADLAELAGDLGLQLDHQQLGFTFTGTAGTLGRLAAELPAPLQGMVEIGLAGRYEMEAEKLSFERLALTKPELLALSAAADLDLAASRMTATLQARIDSAASALAGDAVKWQDLTLAGSATGGLAMPDLDLTLNGRSVTAPAFASRDLSLRLRSVTRDDRLAVEASGTASGNAWSSDLQAFLGDRLDLEVAAEVARDFSKLTIDRLTATAADLRLTGRAALNDQGAVSVASATLDSADLAAFSALTGMKLQGTGRLAVHDGSWEYAHGGGARTAVEFTATGLGLGQADLDRLVGPQPALAGKIEWSPDHKFTVHLDRVDLAETTGPIAATFTDGFARMGISGDLTIQPGALPPEIGVKMPQAARLTVRLDGPVQATAGELELTVPVIETGGARFDKLHLASTMRWSDQAVLSFTNRGEFVLQDKPYRLGAEVALPPDRLQLSRLSLQGAALELAGELELPGYEPPLRGTIGLTRLDAALARAWAPPIAAGQLSGKIDFLPEETKQRLALDFTAKGLRLTGESGARTQGLDRLALRGQVTDAFGEPAFRLQLNAANLAYGGASLARLQATLHGPLAQLRTTVETAGRFQPQGREPLPLTLAGSADIAFAEDLRLEIGKLTAAIGTESIALRRPLQLTRTAAGAMEGAAALMVGAGDRSTQAGLVDGSFRLAPGKEISAKAELAGIALAPWDAMFTRRGLAGVLSATASLTEQAGQAARAQLHGSVSDIRFASLAESKQTAGSNPPALTSAPTAARGKTPQLPPLALQLDATLAAGRLEGGLAMGSADQQVLTATAALPLTVSVLGGQYDFNPRAPLTLTANVDADIARFWPYVPLPDHSLAGRLKLAAALSGSLAEPNLEGTVSLAEGRYEHLQFGTLLQNIRIDGRLDPGRVHLTEIAADDGGKGRLTGTAEIGIGGTPPLAYRATVVMRDMALTRMDELLLSGDIDLNLSGDDLAAAIRGEVKVNRGEVDLAVALPASVPQLEVANLDTTRKQAGQKKAKGKNQEKERDQPGFAANLQVSVDIPGRLFVRGKGLDSEWEGKLEITGPAAEPRLVGQLQARRGQLDVIGKTFLIRDSQITFLGGQPPDPELNILGVHTAGDLTVKANLTGPASKTELTLSSDPQLPQDEILSRILFGKSQGKLSPYEAVQLAGVAAELTGKGGGFDIVGSFRKMLRLDVLRVEGGEQGPQVQVGKYLTEGVYVGTKRGTTADSTGVEVEIELTPHIKATSESNEIDNKAGLQFKWDY